MLYEMYLKRCCWSAVLFDIAFPAIFQSWLDALSVLSLDLYTFIGKLLARSSWRLFGRKPDVYVKFEFAQGCTALQTSTCTQSLSSP